MILPAFKTTIESQVEMVPSRCAMVTDVRSDDNAAIKPKMLYASSKDALKKSLSGINDEFQATDRGDLDHKEVQKKAGGV